MLQFLTVLIMEILAGAEVDLFVPSFPELQKVFGLTPFMVELTLGVNLVAYCASSLIVGNLGDRYGRRPVILLGLIIFIIGSLLCLFATDYWHLLLGRLLQGVGVSAPAVLSYLIIADSYSPEKQQELMGVLNGAITLGMALAPVVGSYVSLWFHWQGNFALLLSMGVLCFITGVLFIPEAQKKPHIAISLREYKPVLLSRKAILYIATICFLVLGYWIFIAISPILYMEDLGVPLSQFGFYQGAMAIVFSIGSFSSPYFLRKFGQKVCFDFGIFMLYAFVVCALLIMLLNVKSPVIITGVMLLSAVGITLPINILFPFSLEAVPDARGKISALITAGRLVGNAIGIQTVSYFYQGTFLPLGVVICVVTALGLWTCYKLFEVENIFSKATS